MPVLVAPDKFKGSLTAREVAAHLAAGLRAAAPGLDVREQPVADGGEGTVDAAVSAGFDRVVVPAHGPTGLVHDAGYARRGDTAVVELAAVCGLLRLPNGPAPLTASTYGLGEVVQHAVHAGAVRVVIGIGGSASTDGGAGMLVALGARVLDAAGHAVPLGGVGLRDAVTLDLSGLDPALAAVELVVASDVDSPLDGPAGAAAVYSPQKGASAAQVTQLDAALHRWAEVVGADASFRGAGAAGGTGYAAVAVLGATLRPGIDVVLDLLHFADLLTGCDLVITGEGRIDEQTLAGKAPAGVAAAARAAGVPVVAVAGLCTLRAGDLAAAGIERVYRLSDLEPSLRASIGQAGPLLERVAGALAHDRRLTPARQETR